MAALWVAQRRWAARSGDAEDISRLAVWSVIAGLIGTRVYHLITDYQRFQRRWLHVFAVWEGGLGIPGGPLAVSAPASGSSTAAGYPPRSSSMSSPAADLVTMDLTAQAALVRPRS